MISSHNQDEYFEKSYLKKIIAMKKEDDFFKEGRLKSAFPKTAELSNPLVKKSTNFVRTANFLRK